MRIRTTYLKVSDMERGSAFWENLLERAPNRRSDKWTEFSLGEVRFGLLLNDFGDEFVGSGCVPVFEFDVSALHIFLDRAKAFGATVALDGLNNEAMKSIVLVSPDGHEFELCCRSRNRDARRQTCRRSGWPLRVRTRTLRSSGESSFWKYRLITHGPRVCSSPNATSDRRPAALADDATSIPAISILSPQSLSASGAVCSDVRYGC
ncbi:VOC family protein [Paraburkholderia sp. MM6662-R1]|uniref:VOC family protein n=1 Tax=Paraburkholderia sp. MM6662-R1 TaxID=2991066 RepID=UPI003D1E0B49